MLRNNKLLMIQILKEGLYLGTLLLIAYFFSLKHNFNLFIIILIFIIAFLISGFLVLRKQSYKKSISSKLLFGPMESINLNLRVIILFLIIIALIYFIFGRFISILIMILIIIVLTIYFNFFKKKKFKEKNKSRR